MQFTEGIWMDRCGLKVHRAQKLWRYELYPDAVKVMVPAHKIKDISDTTRGPVLTFIFTAPREDMISVKVTHYRGKTVKGPAFSLNLQNNAAPQILDGEKELTFRSGRMETRIAKEGPFGFAFFYDGRLMTSAGNQGTAYVTDLDYEADKARDFNGREPVAYDSRTWMRELLSLDVGEYIYGLGERFTPLARNGQSADVWNRDGGSGGDQAYKNIPFYLSGKGYGVFVNTPGLVNFEFGTVNTRNVEFSVPGESLEYIVIGAEAPKGVLSGYTALTGRSPVPPAWSFGLWLSTSWEPETTDQTVLTFIEGMAEREIPLSVFHFDARWMDDFNCCDFVWSKRFGDARGLLKKLHGAGIRVCVWINPYVSQEGRLFDEGAAGGYFLKTKSGDVWQTDGWMSGMAIVDFTNPAACAWYKDRLGAIIDMGADCIKTDFGERIPTDVAYFDGSDPALMHNYYPFLYNKVIFEMLKEKKGGKNACVFSRSATAGTQQFPVNWGGDNEATYISMAESLRGGLSLCQSGFGFWAHDISGFSGTATPDLYKRWAAFGMLSTHSRLHGKETYRVPWLFDGESPGVLRFFTRLKCSLMPYLYAGAVKVNREGVPLMQAMALAYPRDRTCLPLDTQYMLGDDLLVAPVFKDSGEAEFYLPSGGWTDFLSGERFEGGRWHIRQYGYYGLPLLARAGAVIPVGGVDSTVEYEYNENLTFRWYAPETDGETRCPVYRMDEELALIAVAKREGRRLTFSVEGKGYWKLLWLGAKPVSVKGGSVMAGEQAYFIETSGGAISFEVE